MARGFSRCKGKEGQDARIRSYTPASCEVEAHALPGKVWHNIIAARVHKRRQCGTGGRCHAYGGRRASSRSKCEHGGLRKHGARVEEAHGMKI